MSAIKDNQESVVIELEQVCYAYAQTQVLRGVSMTLKAGQVFGLLGSNGAGKTTTIRLLTGQLQPQAGRVRVFGLEPVANPREVRSRIGLMTEDNGHYQRLSVEKNLLFFARLYGVEQPLAQAHSYAKRVGLEDKLKTPVSGLSRGMRQRLGLARALVGRPSLLVLDEPTAGLDPYNARAVRELIAEFCSGGGTVFLTTHYMEEAEELCDQIAILAQGSFVCLGNPLDLCAQYLPQTVEVKRAGRMVRQKPGVEELFYALTGRIISDTVEKEGNAG